MQMKFCGKCFEEIQITDCNGGELFGASENDCQARIL